MDSERYNKTHHYMGGWNGAAAQAAVSTSVSSRLAHSVQDPS